MFHKIVLGSDGSEAALQAAAVAATIAKLFNSTVYLVSVFDPAPLLMVPAPGAAPPVDLALSIAEETHTRVLRETGQVLADAGVAHRCVKEMGHPVFGLVETAQKEKADLVVLGSRGLSNWQSLLLGSVADGVLHHAPCPVWIVRGTQTTFDKILLASDDAEPAHHAASAAGELAQKLGVPLTLLNVVEPLSLVGIALNGEVDAEGCSFQARGAAWERLQSLAEGLGDNCSGVQEVGHPAETIVRYARNENFPLIVMGSRGRGNFQTLTLGSVSRHVAHQAHCSLLLTK